MSLVNKKPSENLDETRDDINSNIETQRQHLRYSFHDITTLDAE